MCGAAGAVSLTRSTTVATHNTDTVYTTPSQDRIAIDVYRRAEAAGEPITLGLVERHLAELLSHDLGLRVRAVRSRRESASR